MTSSPSTVTSSVRRLRERAGWSQSELGARIGLTRQSVAAIESAGVVPSTEVALRLAAVFSVRVEEVFALREAPAQAFDLDAAEVGLRASGRVRIATVAGRRRAYGVGITDAGGVPAADGVGVTLPDGRIRVEPFEHRPPAPQLVVAGCDPAFGLVRDRLARDCGVEVLWIRTGSRAALAALARGEVHVAGIHLKDERSGAYNQPWVERTVPFPTTRIAFATWEQTLLLGRGNPLNVEGFDDLARPDLRFLNREVGSGSRALMESTLASHGLHGADIPGFEGTSAAGHEIVAQAIAAGAADAGVAIRAVGAALGLPMLPLAEEPYDFVVANHFLELPAVDALFTVLRSRALRAEIGALPGYDPAHMGRPA